MKFCIAPPNRVEKNPKVCLILSLIANLKLENSSMVIRELEYGDKARLSACPGNPKFKYVVKVKGISITLNKIKPTVQPIFSLKVKTFRIKLDKNNVVTFNKFSFKGKRYLSRAQEII